MKAMSNLEKDSSNPTGRRPVLSVTHNDGDVQRWLRENKKHRLDGPAEVHLDGKTIWSLLGRWHREDGPAFVETNGTRGWYFRGLMHRVGGPALIDSSGNREWRHVRDKAHRLDGLRLSRQTIT